MRAMNQEEMRNANGGYTYRCVWPCGRTFKTAVAYNLHLSGCVYAKREGFEPVSFWDCVKEVLF